MRERNGGQPIIERDQGDLVVRTQEAFTRWLADMDNRPGAQLKSFGYDLANNPEQDLGKAKLDASDPHPHLPDWLHYLGVGAIMTEALGRSDYRRLRHQLSQQTVSSTDSTPLIERLIANQEGDEDGENKRNTLIVTSHFTFAELGFFKALRYLEKEDRPRMSMGGVLLNWIMTRQTFNGKKVVDHFKPTNVYFSHPISESSTRHGVPGDTIKRGNILFFKALLGDLKKGGLELDAALTGRQVYRDEQTGHHRIPDVSEASAKLLDKFDDVVGVTMIWSPVTKQWEMKIGELIDIKKMRETKEPEEIVDLIYGDIAGSIQEFTGEQVDYSSLAVRMGHQAIKQANTPSTG